MRVSARVTNGRLSFTNAMESYSLTTESAGRTEHFAPSQEIRYVPVSSLSEMETRAPGTLLNNCGYDLWRRRYHSSTPRGSTHYPWKLTEPLEGPIPECTGQRDRHISEWTVDFQYKGGACTLFGCCEDIECVNNAKHDADFEQAPFRRKLCAACQIPICRDCWCKLSRHDATSTTHNGCTIPMSLSNDHYYGYVNKYIVEQNVTWLECAASCLIWSTMLVYYLESPYGHLMDVAVGQPQGRTHVKGNLFSFGMPWEDIEKCCHQAIRNSKEPEASTFRKLKENLGLPHSEETLALLVNVHIVGGSKDLALKLKGLTMRVDVVQGLINILRESGYPGYEKEGLCRRRLTNPCVNRKWDEEHRPLGVFFVPSNTTHEFRC